MSGFVCESKDYSGTQQYEWFYWCGSVWVLGIWFEYLYVKYQLFMVVLKGLPSFWLIAVTVMGQRDICQLITIWWG